MADLHAIAGEMDGAFPLTLSSERMIGTVAEWTMTLRNRAVCVTLHCTPGTSRHVRVFPFF